MIQAINAIATSEQPLPARVGRIRGRSEQAVLLAMCDAVARGDLDAARAWRVQLVLPRGVSAKEGSQLLQTLGSDPSRRGDAVRLLARESITWHNTQVRQLLDQAQRATQRDIAMPGRLLEQLAEAVTLADLPPEVCLAAGIDARPLTNNDNALSPWLTLQLPISTSVWQEQFASVHALRMEVESTLPSLLTEQEKERRQRLLLKLVMLVPREYAAGVRDGKITVPMEYREAVSFTAQARQLVGELAPLWLSGDTNNARRSAMDQLEEHLATADDRIAAKDDSDLVQQAMHAARDVLQDDLGITLARSGTTADIVDEIMLQTRSLLAQSFAAATNGNYRQAESLRLEAYTTYDPELEARLMPRDPQLATDIESLLLDGLDQPGVKMLLDQRANSPELEAAYVRVTDALDRAASLLKSAVTPTAAAINAGSIVLREGLEGLLVLVAIFAGLRGDENRPHRRMIWLGVALSGVATLITVILSRTLITSLIQYGEIIEALVALLAIGVLLLITNWLFHQIYWRQWVTTLKHHAGEGESAWQLVSVGFLMGYREGFETVLFLQSLLLDVGYKPVGIGVGIGLLLLVALGFAALKLGMKLPYFKLLMATALLIGIVLITFVGGGVRTMQTVGWLSVHKIAPVSFPAWVGRWLGVYNSWETVIGQVLIAGIVLGTWRVSRWKSRRISAQRRRQWDKTSAPDELPQPATPCSQ
jgi:high-affinity iron transporter